MNEEEKNQPPSQKKKDFSNLRALGITALAFLLYLLLIDTAVETFLSKSPVKWWVAGIVAAYFGASVWLWRKLEWAAKATASFFVLVGLLAFTVWLPGGLTQGLTLLGLSTSALLSLVTAVAVAFSGLILFQLRYPHPAIKWVIAVLTTYGAFAFLWAIYAGTSYPALFSGYSFWSWLPRWLQGAFIGALVLVPLAILLQIAIRLRRLLPSESRDWGFQQVVPLAMVLATTVAAVTVPAGSAITPGQISKRGPGMKRQALDTFQLSVPRTFDLTHVEPAHFAVALGKDPAKIFEFMRDNIAYEVYTGSLRGPRGTLMAMAGNSVDRASLLASMLQHAGHRVRYVRGRLPDRVARELVTSMWAERPRAAEPKVEGELSPALKAALATLKAGVKRDYTLIRDHLKKANITPSPQSAPSLDSLVQEAQEHYWVQWWKDNTWVDLDPSFADATPGRKYTPSAGSPLDALPDALFHRVTVRVRLEEYSVLNTGNAEGQPSSREILSYTAKAAELSGVDLLFSHQPEKWRGPATSIQAAIASAIENTGRVKPVLIIGESKWVSGLPFRQKLPTGGGIGGIPDLLGGAGTRKPVPIATAESIEFDFISPGGYKETVVREVFDLVGKARRTTGKNLNADEVRRRIEGKTAVDLTQGIYGLFFTTGHIQAAHLSNLVEVPPPASGEPPDIRTFIRRINVTFTATSDGLIGRVGRPGRAAVLFYPDSPRVQIVEVSTVAGASRLSLDLRRDHTRAVSIGPYAADAFFGRVLRGVVNGTLERVLMEHITAGLREKKPGWGSTISTSFLFEQAHSEKVPTVLLPRESGRLEGGVADDVLARLREETSGGYLAIVPQHPVTIASVPRSAWWRINPHSGQTIAVTDKGLHEWVYFQRRGEQQVHVTYYEFVGERTFLEIPTGPWQAGSQELANFILGLLENGETIIAIIL